MKRVIWVITAIALLLSIVPITFAEEDMVSLYVRNHSFEEGELGFVVSGDEIPGWSLFGEIPETSMSGADYMFIEVADKSRKGLDLAYSQCKVPADGEKCLSVIDGLMSAALYVKSDEIAVKEGVEYTLTYDLWTDWRGAHGMAFYNESGKLYKNGNWIDATDANLRSICGNGYTASTPPPGITTYKSNVWNTVKDKFTAPSGAVKARILLFSAVAANANSNFDNIRLEFPRSVLKADAKLENGNFENGLEGWEELFGRDMGERVSVSTELAGCMEISGGEEIFIASEPFGVFENTDYLMSFESAEPLTDCKMVFFNEKGEIYSSFSNGFVSLTEENLKIVLSDHAVSEAPEGAAFARVVVKSAEEKIICGQFEITFTSPDGFKVSAPVLEKNGEHFTEEDEYCEGDTLKVKFSFYNGKDESEKIKLIICSYHNDGSLSGITVKNITADGVPSGEVNAVALAEETVNANITDGYIRVFAVNSFVMMNDFVRPLEHKLLIGEGE